MNNITITDLSRFGYRERQIAEALLKAWNEGDLPEDFHDNEVVIMMNTHSGSVFLTNSEYQVAMLNGNKLESFYHDSETGEEGFKEELSPKALLNLGLINPDEVIHTTSTIINDFEYDHDDRKTLELLLLAWNEDNLPEDFSRENIRIAKDKYGTLFLSNAENQIAMLDSYDVRLCSINPETGEMEFIEE